MYCNNMDYFFMISIIICYLLPARTVYGDHDRYRSVYLRPYPGRIFILHYMLCTIYYILSSGLATAYCEYKLSMHVCMYMYECVSTITTTTTTVTADAAVVCPSAES